MAVAGLGVFLCTVSNLQVFASPPLPGGPGAPGDGGPGNWLEPVAVGIVHALVDPYPLHPGPISPNGPPHAPPAPPPGYGAPHPHLPYAPPYHYAPQYPPPW